MLLMARARGGVVACAEKAAEDNQRQGAKARNYHLHTFQRYLRVIKNSREDADANYRVLVHLEKPSFGSRAKEPKPTLSYWCFKPGVAMQVLKKEKGCRSIILTSGTLCPLNSLECELGLPFERTLENVHVIQPKQIWIGCVPVGPSGKTLNSSFRSRDTKEYKMELGNTIVNFARIVPDGVLVFFPSYTVLNACVEEWKGSNVWERIAKWKLPVLEPRDSSEFTCVLLGDAKSSLGDAKSSLGDA
jgi:regulator of telomere elongation helicase 1